MKFLLYVLSKKYRDEVRTRYSRELASKFNEVDEMLEKIYRNTELGANKSYSDYIEYNKAS